jgi:hypothetical protein
VVGPPDVADGVALGAAPGSGLAAPLPGVAASSAGFTAVVVAGGAVGGGAGVELLQATIARLATITRRADDALRIVQGVAPIPAKVSRRVDAMTRGLATDIVAPFDVLAFVVTSRQDGSGPNIVTAAMVAFCEKMLPVTSAVTESQGAPSFSLRR